MLEKIISGGQTGADQAGLLAAHKLGLKTGGTAPSEFYTDWGPNPLLEVFGLAAEGDYRSRTIKNVRNSDGTVLLTSTPNSPGSVLTRNQAHAQAKPFLQLDTTPAIQAFKEGRVLDQQRFVAALSAELQFFIASNEIKVLNVAGNREKDRKEFSTTRIVEAVICDTIRALEACGLVTRTW